LWIAEELGSELAEHREAAPGKLCEALARSFPYDGHDEKEAPKSRKPIFRGMANDFSKSTASNLISTTSAPSYLWPIIGET
jgi:hypothetical protein